MSKKINKFRNFRISNKAKSIILTVLMVLLIFGVLCGITSIIKNRSAKDGYDLCEVTWKSGGIDAEGLAISDKRYMYSSEIEVRNGQKLHIEQEFGTNAAYTVFYYDENDNLIFKDATETKVNYTKTVSDIESELSGKKVDHVRIALHSLDDDEGELSIFDRSKFADKIKVYTCDVGLSNSEVD